MTEEIKQIDYISLRAKNAQVKSKKVYGYQYLPYAPVIEALKHIGWQHREIVSYFNDFLGLPAGDRADNNQLCKMRSYWKSKNLIDYEKVKIEIRKIEGSIEQEKELQKKEEINIHSTGANAPYSLGSFMRSYSQKTGVQVSGELTGTMKNFYEDNKDKVSLDQLVSDFILVQDGQFSRVGV